MNYRNFIKTPFELHPPQKIIIDTHGGLEDILAIVYAHRLIQLNGGKQEIVGITCVAGKNSLEDAVKSALVANHILGTKIPIFRGQNKSLLLNTEYPETYLTQKFDPIEQKLYKLVEGNMELVCLVQNEKAVDFITRSCLEYQNLLGIISLGPVTNLGLAQKLEGQLSLVGLISLTGGQYMGVGNTVKGNVEANFAHDPLAAHILFFNGANCLKDKIYVNVIEQSLGFDFRAAIQECLSIGVEGEIKNILSEVINSANTGSLTLGTLLTVTPFIVPTAIAKKLHVYGEIIRDGGVLNGLLAINWLKVGAHHGEYSSFFHIYEDFDRESIKKLFSEALRHNNIQIVQP